MCTALTDLWSEKFPTVCISSWATGPAYGEIRQPSQAAGLRGRQSGTLQDCWEVSRYNYLWIMQNWSPKSFPVLFVDRKPVQIRELLYLWQFHDTKEAYYYYSPLILSDWKHECGIKTNLLKWLISPFGKWWKPILMSRYFYYQALLFLTAADIPITVYCTVNRHLSYTLVTEFEVEAQREEGILPKEEQRVLTWDEDWAVQQPGADHSGNFSRCVIRDRRLLSAAPHAALSQLGLDLELHSDTSFTLSF